MDDTKILERLNAPGQLPEHQLRELRAKYFTVRHQRIIDCGHKLDALNEPRHRNCEACWFLFFETHPDLVTTADKAYLEQGRSFLDRMRGQKFTDFFVRYMATKLALQKEKENEQRRKVQTDSDSRQESGQDLRRDDISETGGSSEQTSPVDSDQPVVG